MHFLRGIIRFLTVAAAIAVSGESGESSVVLVSVEGKKTHVNVHHRAAAASSTEEGSHEGTHIHHKPEPHSLISKDQEGVISELESGEEVHNGRSKGGNKVKYY
jgi:hypothetical protein